MQKRFLLGTACSLILVQICAVEEQDYLQKGDRKPFNAEDAKYLNAVRDVLAHGWQKDVVLRVLDLPAFSPERVTGVSRKPAGYRAFAVTASPQIWEELGFGSTDPHKRRGDYSKVRPIVRERSIPDPIAVRIASVWRAVLADKRNYGKDPHLYIDTDQFSFYLGFLPKERVTANAVGWGTKLEQLLTVADVLGNYAERKCGIDKLDRALAKAESKLRI